MSPTSAFMAGDVPHVLAVDDSLVDRKVIERLLKNFACRVTTVESGRRALQFLGIDGDQKPSLKVNMIITDYCMPGMNGFELLQKIKSSTLREIPVVVMSSENVVARIDRCLEEGAEEFIVKPVKPSDLKRLKDHLAGKKIVEQVGDGNQARSRKRKLSSSPSSPSSSSSSSLLSCNDHDVIPPASPSSSQPPQKLARRDTQSATVDSLLA